MVTSADSRGSQQVRGGAKFEIELSHFGDPPALGTFSYYEPAVNRCLILGLAKSLLCQPIG